MTVKRRINGTIFHWSASGSMTLLSDIRRWHVHGNGWSDIGYHRVILHPDAEPEAKQWGQLVKPGRPLNNDLYMESYEVGAHTLGYNTGYIGVCVVGAPSYPLHPLQREAIIHVAKVFSRRFDYPIKNTWGHRDYNATQCPGNEIYKLIQEIKKGAA